MSVLSVSDKVRKGDRQGCLLPRMPAQHGLPYGPKYEILHLVRIYLSVGTRWGGVSFPFSFVSAQPLCQLHDWPLIVAVSTSDLG